MCVGGGSARVSVALAAAHACTPGAGTCDCSSSGPLVQVHSRTWQHVLPSLINKCFSRASVQGKAAGGGCSRSGADSALAHTLGCCVQHVHAAEHSRGKGAL